ncbi:MAG: DUF4278 domain-containing protein [Leptolyngbyaceae cyanobacterium bins.59]|nr:DUF4278 domain-containing protein [Leptolyngbyaceae cyanobacterium bins.59]
MMTLHYRGIAYEPVPAAPAAQGLVTGKYRGVLTPIWVSSTAPAMHSATTLRYRGADYLA